ncbi:MAG: hypothetical protein MRY74_08485 [Neomegalonema sp.]|nr:hypothetical protein [Neomegalonema sp.]
MSVLLPRARRRFALLCILLLTSLVSGCYALPGKLLNGGQSERLFSEAHLTLVKGARLKLVWSDGSYLYQEGEADGEMREAGRVRVWRLADGIYVAANVPRPEDAGDADQGDIVAIAIRDGETVFLSAGCAQRDKALVEMARAAGARSEVKSGILHCMFDTREALTAFATSLAKALADGAVFDSVDRARLTFLKE